ncbi:hypothetical protein AB0953_28055 [Streptomyces sp. NPDC046866]|uniref:hypothetical protein n=1 Tax=Streptomyces sp. NPDC046866 TaxID=3154921 RepID=UPI0034524B92
MAGHIHGEDGCTGCQDKGTTDWQARRTAITAMQPDIIKWFDREVWTAALHDTGYGVTRTCSRAMVSHTPEGPAEPRRPGG